MPTTLLTMTRISMGRRTRVSKIRVPTLLLVMVGGRWRRVRQRRVVAVIVVVVMVILSPSMMARRPEPETTWVRTGSVVLLLPPKIPSSSMVIPRQRLWRHQIYIYAAISPSSSFHGLPSSASVSTATLVHIFIYM